MKRYKTSISKRLFKTILIIVLAFALLVMLFNTLLLRPLYRFYTKQALRDTLQQVSALDFETSESTWQNELRQLEQGNTFEILIYDNLSLIYATNDQSKWMGMGRQMGMHHDEIIQRIRQDRDDPAQVLEEVRARGVVRDLVYQTAEKDGYTIIITQVMDAIDSTIRQSNMVVAGVTLLFLGATLVVAFLLAKSFTRPIKSMQTTVDSINRLNFDAVCQVSTGDELEHLADDINALSEHLKQTLAELNAKNLQLEKDILSQRQFIANASHELRTPLSLIKGYSDELMGGYIEDAEQQKAVTGIISDEAGKMNRLLKEMLDLSRMESGRMQLELRTASVSDQIKAFLEKYSGYIAEKQLNIQLSLDPQDDTALFDAMRFEQILANYLSNAAKYGDEKHQIRITSLVQEKTVRIRVFNSGPALSETALEKIWDRFYKQDSSRTQDENSYGLGLSIVAAIQSLSGQAFGAENHPDGVTFWFDVAHSEELSRS